MAKKTLNEIAIAELLEASEDELQFSDKDSSDFEDLEGVNENLYADEDLTEVLGEEIVATLTAGEPSEPVEFDLDAVNPLTPARNVVWFANRDNDGDWAPFLGQKKINVEGNTPLDFFLQIFDEGLIQNIAIESNLYGMQNGAELKTDSKELKIFLGINLIMSYIKYPRIKMYWARESGLRFENIANHMTHRRYQMLRTNLHFIDSQSIPPNNLDKAIRIRPILDRLNHNSQTAYDTGEFLSIDEMLVPFKDRSSLKNYLPMKHKKW